jgi:hypothetical protein
VRISIQKGQFEKEITHKWSKELFEVAEVLYTNPHTYKLKDMKGKLLLGSFYTEEIQLISKSGEKQEKSQEIEVLKRGRLEDKNKPMFNISMGTKFRSVVMI